MRRGPRWELTGLLAGLGGFIVIATDYMVRGPIHRADTLVNDAVSRWQQSGGPAHAIGDLLTLIGDWRTEAAVVVAAVAWMSLRRQWVLAAWCLGIGMSSAVAVNLLKAFFDRARPPLGHLESLSFPSGHTFGAAAVIGAAIILSTETYIRAHRADRKETFHLWAMALGLWAFLSFLTAAGRVLVQEHWMSDVLASICLGFALVSGILYVLSRKSRGGDPAPTVPEKAPATPDDAKAT